LRILVTLIHLLHLLLVLLVLHLTANFIIVVKSDSLLLILNVVGSGIHSHLRFYLFVALLLQLINDFVTGWHSDLLLVLLVQSVLIFIDLFKKLPLVMIAPPDMAGRQTDWNQLLIFFELSHLLFIHNLLHLGVLKNFFLHVFGVILVGLVLLGYLLVALQNSLLFTEVHLLAHLDLLVLLRNNVPGFVTKCSTLLEVLLYQCTFLRVLGFLRFKHEIALIVPVHVFDFLVLLFDCYGFI